MFSGYMAPEYAIHGLCSTKSDVLSFGGLVLEMITRQQDTSFRYGEEEEYLLTYVSENIYY